MAEDGDVVVTGLGAISALGEGAEALWQGLRRGRCGIGSLRRFSTEGMTVSVAALVPGHDSPEEDLDELCLELAQRAAVEALDDAGWRPGDIAPGRGALVVGTSVGGDDNEPCHLAESVLGDHPDLGPRVTVSTACTSSTTALGLARDLLRVGKVDRVLAGGADVLTPDLFAGFHALGVLSPRPCAPFSEPPGASLGEGAAFFVLERRSEAEQRGATPRAVLLGWGLSGDAHHETAPHPRGRGVAGALRSTLSDAGLEPTVVQYVNAHGTGTTSNDAAEWQAIRAVLCSGRPSALPVSSTKGHLGHAQGAAGALEVAATLLAMERGALPPTLNFHRPRRNAPDDPIGQLEPRAAPVEVAISTNSAFAGANSAVAIGSPYRSAPRRRAAAPLLLVGAAAIVPPIIDLATLTALIERQEELPKGDLDLEALLPRADERHLDPAAILLAAASARTLEDAGEGRLRGRARGRTGSFVAASRPSPQSARAFRESKRRRGLARVSTHAFARMVLSASQGSTAQLLSLRGPQTTLALGPGGPLVALSLAAEHLATRDDVDLILAGAVEERDLEDPADDRTSGAACVALSRQQQRDRPSITLESWSIGAPGQLEGAIRAVLRDAGQSAEGIDGVFGRRAREWSAAPAVVCHDPRRLTGEAGTLTAALALASAVAWLGRPEGPPRAERALVADPGGGSACCALLLRRQGHGS